MTATLPRTLDEYLDAVRAALADADPALVQDALYDAEEHLRSEMAEQPELDEAALIAKVASSYGSPEEVAAIYRDTEVQVSKALRTPAAPRRESLLGRFFGVAADPRTYGALFYMVLSLATGIFYFAWAVTGISISAGLIVLIIGVPFALLFLGSVRLLSLVEGRLVEVMLGIRMPRRPLYARRDETWTARIGAMVKDPRTWSTLLYMVLKLPLGIVYFVIVVVGLALSFGFIASPFAWIFGHNVQYTFESSHYVPPVIALPLLFALGVFLLFALMHVARGVGYVHGQIAKHFLVRSA